MSTPEEPDEEEERKAALLEFHREAQKHIELAGFIRGALASPLSLCDPNVVFVGVAHASAAPPRRDAG